MKQQTTMSRPWRSLGVLLGLCVALLAAMWVTGAWTPRLGLDLAGGTSITLTAKTPDGGTPSNDQMTQALAIISDRVNGAGVAEPDIVRSGSDNIVVSVPTRNPDQIVALVGQTAQLRFRDVLSVLPGGAPTPTSSPTASPSGSPTASPSASPTGSAKPSPSASATPSPQASASAQPAASPSPASSPNRTSSLTSDPAKAPAAATPQQLAQLQALDCSTLKLEQPDDPNAPLLTCDREGKNRYLLGPAVIDGRDLTGATAGIPQNQVQWQVNLEFNGNGADRFRAATTRLAQAGQYPQNAFAIVLDGRVVSTPTVNEVIPNGQAQITGSFTQADATDLANVLKYGSLPLTFDTSEVTTVSPQLGADQLHNGLIAGAIGLVLVVVAAFLYYRALGMVVVASLTVAGAITYGLICLLGATLGLALVLAGVVGLIVAIGITADSFVILFERVRDEIREGRSIRMAVETGWRRARRTIVVSDAVSLAAAVFLYIFAAGSVKGFAFTLGLTTLVDVLVVFMFTKPLLTLLVRSRFFGTGHPLSGLDPVRIGAPAPLRKTKRPVAAREA